MATVPATVRKAITWDRVKGVTLAFMSVVCFSIMVLCVKLLKDIHAFEVCLIRMAGQAIIIAPCFLFVKVDLKPLRQSKSTVLFLCLRGLLGTSAMTCNYYAVKATEMGDATAIIFSSPIFVTLFGCIFLKERPTLPDILILCLTAVGCLFVAHPQFVFGQVGQITHTRLMGLVSASVGCVLTSITFIIIRQLRNVHYLIVVEVFAVWGTFQLLVICLATGVLTAPKPHEWLLLCCIGGLAAGGQMCMTKALQLERAALVSVVRSFDIVLAFIFQILVIHEQSSAWSIVGASLVVTSVAAVSLKKIFSPPSPTEESEADSDYLPLSDQMEERTENYSKTTKLALAQENGTIRVDDERRK